MRRNRTLTLVSSLGGNQHAIPGNGCGFLPALDQLQSTSAFALSLGQFGGESTVPGWSNDGLSRPQRSFAQSSYCSLVDVRGLPRNDGACDAGAFEQQP